jgi:putative transposase
MSRAKTSAEDYIQWLIASPKDATMTESSRCSPQPVAHDSYRRLLLSLEPDSDALWEEVKGEVELEHGILVLDDSTLDKPYGPSIELVVRHWSGKHRSVVDGINLITLLWTDGEVAIPIDYRIFDKKRDGLSKNDHFRDMLKNAQERGFQPAMVVFDSWYASLENLKFIQQAGWTFLTCLPQNRKVSPVKGITITVGQLMADESGVLVHLTGFGFVRVFPIDRKDAGMQFWATNDTKMDSERCESLRSLGTWIEGYHRSIKQYCLVERCQARKAVIQRNHIGLAIRAFVRLELHRFDLGISIFELKRRIIREAMRVYRTNPFYTPNRLVLQTTA